MKFNEYFNEIPYRETERCILRAFKSYYGQLWKTEKNCNLAILVCQEIKQCEKSTLKEENILKEENRTYIITLKVHDVPWHRLATPYGRGTDFPTCFETLVRMDDLDSVKSALYTLINNLEHQSTFWHVTPFGMVFLSRILGQVLTESGQNPMAHFLTEKLLDFFICILQCFHDMNELEHAAPLPLFSDLLKEEYLWSEEYNEEEDEMRYDDAFPDDLFYSFYYYSWQAVLAYQNVLEQEVPQELIPKIAEVLTRL